MRRLTHEQPRPSSYPRVLHAETFPGLPELNRHMRALREMSSPRANTKVKRTPHCDAPPPDRSPWSRRRRPHCETRLFEANEPTAADILDVRHRSAVMAERAPGSGPAQDGR